MAPPGSRVALGHRRLSIVDLSPSGHQPMCYLRGRYWITFNGEIYNHPEVRAELQKSGHCFASRTDTEVILAAYHEWGPHCLHRFNGMWAFAIYDTLEDTLFLARDRLGVKPLYWWADGSTFIFASEPKAILAHPRVSARPNADYLARYARSGAEEHIVHTAFAGVHRILHGHYCRGKIDEYLSSPPSPRRWWHPRDDPSSPASELRQPPETSEHLFELLKSSVRLRLRADVRVGSALSGGLDSSSIVFLICELLRESGTNDLQETFSCVYGSRDETRDCDEGFFIRALTRHLRIQNHMIEPVADDIPGEHARMIRAMDTPPESTCMSGWHTFKLVQQRGIRVTMDGQGADEQLGGYLTYLANALGAPGWKHRITTILGGLRIHPAHALLKAILVASCGHALPAGALGRLGRWFPKTGFVRGATPLNDVLLDDTLSGLVSLVHYSDRVSMAHSVESRMPFLDFRLVEYLVRVPEHVKIHQGWTKWQLRQAFDRRLPASIVWRKDKMGWPIPERHWFRGPLRPWFEDRVRAGFTFLSELGLGSVAAACRESARIQTRVRLANLATWAETFL